MNTNKLKKIDIKMKKINFLNLGKHPITNNFLSKKIPKMNFFII